MDDVTTIISDIHLGSECCQAKKLNDFLDGIEERSNRLVLNGDVFDSMDFRRLNKHHWHILSRLRKISDKIQVIWVLGNHDGESAEVVSHLLGIDVVDKYEFVSGDKKILAFHGHIFDNFIDFHPVLTWIGDTIYSFLQKIDKLFMKRSGYSLAREVKHNSKEYLRCAENIKLKAIELAEQRKCNIVCCGHTHHATVENIGPIQYVNSGCWTEASSHFVVIKNGAVEICVFK